MEFATCLWQGNQVADSQHVYRSHIGCGHTSGNCFVHGEGHVLLHRKQKKSNYVVQCAHVTEPFLDGVHNGVLFCCCADFQGDRTQEFCSFKDSSRDWPGHLCTCLCAGDQQPTVSPHQPWSESCVHKKTHVGVLSQDHWRWPSCHGNLSTIQWFWFLRGEVQRDKLLLDIQGVAWCHDSCHGGQEDDVQDMRTQRHRQSQGQWRSSSCILMNASKKQESFLIVPV